MTTVGPECDDLRAVERRIARELARLTAVRPLSGHLVGPPAYVRRHLAEHAAAAGELDSLLIDPGFLLAASQPELLACLSAARSAEGRVAALVYQRVAHHLRDDPVREWASQLELAARRANAIALADATANLAPSRDWACTWARWRSETPHKVIARHGAAVVHVGCAMLPDGRVWVVSCGLDYSLRVVDLVRNEAVETTWSALKPPVSQVKVVTLPDGSPAILIKHWESGLQMWDLTSGAPLSHRIPHDSAGIKHIRWIRLPGGQTIAVIDYFDTTVRAWDPWTGEQVGRTIAGFCNRDRHWTIAPAVLPDGRMVVVTADEDEPVVVWDLETGDPVGEPITGHSGRVMELFAWQLPDGRPIVITAGDDIDVRIWDLATGAPAGSPLVGAGPRVGAVTCTRLPDGRDVVITDTRDGGIRIWDLATREPVGDPLSGHPGSIRAMTCARLPDDREVLITGGNENTVWLWDLTLSNDPTPTGVSPVSSVGQVASVTVTGHHDGSVRFWDSATGCELHEGAAAQPEMVWATACVETEYGRRLAVTGADSGKITLWDLATGKGQLLGSHDGTVLSVTCAPLPDGRTVAATGGTDSVVRTWDLNTRTELLRIHVPSKKSKNRRDSNLVTALTHITLPDGRVVLISGGGDGTMRVWDLVTGQPIGKPMISRDRDQPSPAEISAIACIRLADGRIVAVVGSEDTTHATVVAWDLLAGKQLAITRSRTGWVRGVVCTNLPDGSLVAITGDDVLRIWSLDTLSGLALRSPVDWTSVREIDFDAPVSGLALGADSSVLIGTLHGVIKVRLDRLCVGVTHTNSGNTRS